MKIFNFTMRYTVMTVTLLLLAGNTMAREGTLQNIGDGICFDKISGLMWQIDKSKRFSNIQKVKEYVGTKKLGDFTDWRLPTTQESSELRGIIAI